MKRDPVIGCLLALLFAVAAISVAMAIYTGRSPQYQYHR